MIIKVETNPRNHYILEAVKISLRFSPFYDFLYGEKTFAF